MDARSLEELLDRYRRSSEGWDDLFRMIVAELYRHPRRYGLLSEDDVGEIFSRYPDKLRGIVDKYRDYGADFRTYLAACLRFVALTLRRNDRRDRHGTSIMFAEYVEHQADYYGEFEETVTDACVARELEPGFRSALGRDAATVAFHLSMLLMKNAWLLDDGEVRRAAAAGGLDPDLALERVARAREATRDNLDRYRRAVASRSNAWFALRLAERRISYEEDETKRRMLAEKLERRRRLYRNRTDALERTRILVPNPCIARVLGTAKGTVDSALLELRQRLDGGNASAAGFAGRKSGRARAEAVATRKTPATAGQRRRGRGSIGAWKSS